MRRSRSWEGLAVSTSLLAIGIWMVWALRSSFSDASTAWIGAFAATFAASCFLSVVLEVAVLVVNRAAGRPDDGDDHVQS